MHIHTHMCGKSFEWSFQASALSFSDTNAVTWSARAGATANIAEVPKYLQLISVTFGGGVMTIPQINLCLNINLTIFFIGNYILRKFSETSFKCLVHWTVIYSSYVHAYYIYIKKIYIYICRWLTPSIYHCRFTSEVTTLVHSHDPTPSSKNRF